MPYPFSNPWVLLDALLMRSEAAGLLADYRVSVRREFDPAFVCVSNFGTNRQSSINGVNPKPYQISRDRLPHLGARVPTSYDEHLMTRYRNELMLQAGLHEV